MGRMRQVRPVRTCNHRVTAVCGNHILGYRDIMPSVIETMPRGNFCQEHFYRILHGC